MFTAPSSASRAPAAARLLTRSFPMPSPIRYSETEEAKISRHHKGLPQLMKAAEVIISIRFLYSALRSMDESSTDTGSTPKKKSSSE